MNVKCVFANSGPQLRPSREQLALTLVCQPVERLRSVLGLINVCEAKENSLYMHTVRPASVHLAQ